MSAQTGGIHRQQECQAVECQTRGTGLLVVSPFLYYFLSTSSIINLINRDYQYDNFNFNCSLHIVRCQNTTVEDVSIYGNFNSPNNDGIDIEDSNNTFITRCTIDTGDDAICPKTYNGPLYNLTATNSWIRTKSSAIKFGSASWFDFKGLVFDNITIYQSHRGLGFQIRDGGEE